MRLLDFLNAERLDDETFALRIGGVTKHAVKKWKYGERIPEADRIVAIEKVTNGKVTVHDWANEMNNRSAAPASQEVMA